MYFEKALVGIATLLLLIVAIWLLCLRGNFINSVDANNRNCCD